MSWTSSTDATKNSVSSRQSSADKQSTVVLTPKCILGGCRYNNDFGYWREVQRSLPMMQLAGETCLDVAD
jgi:hypothetical protein